MQRHEKPDGGFTTKRSPRFTPGSVVTYYLDGSRHEIYDNPKGPSIKIYSPTRQLIYSYYENGGNKKVYTNLLSSHHCSAGQKGKLT